MRPFEDIKQPIKNLTVYSEQSISELLIAVGRGEIGAALVINHEEMFQCLLTDGDIRRALLEGASLENKVKDLPWPNTIIGNDQMSDVEMENLFSEKVWLLPIIDSVGHLVDLKISNRTTFIPVAEPVFGGNELKYVSECVLSGWVSSVGKYVTEFEELFAGFCNAKYAVSTSNRTCALHLALLTLGIGEGDEVIVPSLSFISTANAVCFTGAKPVFVDCEREFWNIDVSQIEKNITDKTKAIIPVHLYGHPADMDEINRVAKKHNLKVIEDAAEAHGALYKDRKVGALSDVGVFSFFGNKTITTGEGGMVVTDDYDLAQKIRLYRDHGMDKKIDMFIRF